ncbi:MAG: hypothetical protein EA369_09795 [Bradymonadales bacterium]|nr:MAG: hypothetical protein EA369_09795 [Bradymonadales bacterium]
MIVEKLMERVHLEEGHFELKSTEMPVLEPGVYQVLGKQLFEIYQNYKVSEQDQRRIESLCFFLQSSALLRQRPERSGWLQRLKRIFQ